MTNLLSTTKVQMAGFLALIVLAVIFREKTLISLVFVLLSLATTIGSDLIFTRLRKTPPFLLSAAIVSGVIIGLVSSPNSPWYQMILAGILAMAEKNFIRLNDRHIFNPAAFGLFLTGLIFHHSVSWWGVSGIFFLILLSPGIVSMIRLQRFRITAGFFITYIFLTFLLQGLTHNLDIKNVLINTLFNPAAIFFSLVMLPEPMTSPNNHWRQLFFGIFVAIIAVGSGFIPFFTLSDPLLAGLLLGNILFFSIASYLTTF